MNNHVAIGEIFKVSSGGTPSRKKEEYFENGNIAWVKTGDLKGKFANKPKEFITQLGLDNSSAKLFPAKTVLLAMYGATIGACSILSFEAATNQACAALLPSNDCDEFFLYYYLTSIKQSLINKGVGGAQPNISAGLIKKLKIPLPPLTEQKKIAAILDAADSLRQKDQQLIEHYTALSQSLFLEMFGDPVTNPMGWDKGILKNECTKVTDGTHDTPKRLNSGVKFITGKHIRPYVIDYVNSDYVSEDVHVEIFKRCNPSKGDVLYTNIGVNLGTAALNIVSYEFSMKNVALLKPKENILSGRFLEFYLNNERIKEKIIWMSSIGGAQKFLSLSQLRKLDILLPPIELQNQFAERIEAIEKQKQQAQTNLEKSNALFNSLLQRAFKGELT